MNGQGICGMYTQWNITQLLKKEHIWVSSNDMDKTGAYYSEWSKSKWEKKYCILIHIHGI